MKGKTFIIACVLSILSLCLAPGAAWGQGPIPPEQPATPSPNNPIKPNAQRLPDGLWLLNNPGSLDSVLGQEGALATTALNDSFGYSLKKARFAWVDATGGAILGIDGNTIVPAGLPFTFRFYQNSYNEVLISRDGYLSFTDNQDWLQQSAIPDPFQPNNIIAPYWAPLQVNPSGSEGRIYIKNGGTAPNRFVVVEWYRVQSLDQDSFFTFEVILNENGSILFQYREMKYVFPVWCPAAGIENSTGTVGLNSLAFCHVQGTNLAWRFTRPAPTVGVGLESLNYGGFAGPGEDAKFTVTISNTGQMGDDTFDLTPKSSWGVKLYQDDDKTSLTDSNHNKKPDTGPLSPGESIDIIVAVHTPDNAEIGKSNKASLTVTSARNTSKKKVLTLQSAVPAPFAQTFYNDQDHKMGLLLVEPGQTTLATVENGSDGTRPALAQVENGDLYYLWVKRRCPTNGCPISVDEIEAALVGTDGSTTRAVSRLFDLSGATVKTEDGSPSVAFTPDASTGLTWVRTQTDSVGRVNSNVFFAVLDSTGAIQYGPVNLTGNNDWHLTGDATPVYARARIAATGDDRFFIIWQEDSLQPGGTVNDIIYTIRTTDGMLVSPVARLTSDTPGKAKGFSWPVVTGLRNNRVMAAWNSTAGVSYTIFNSDGVVYKPNQLLTKTTGTGLSATELSTGKVLLAWTGVFKNHSQINYAVLNNGTFNPLGAVVGLNPAAATAGSDFVSVTADGEGRGILTWMDNRAGSHKNLYYSLVGASGKLATPPMIFLSEATGTLWTAEDGQGSARFAGQP